MGRRTSTECTETDVSVEDISFKERSVEYLSSSKDSRALNRGTRSTSAFDSVLRSLKLHLVEYLLPWTRSHEKRKVALYRDRRVAALHSLVHLPPFIGALTLIILNIQRYYVGPSSNGTAQLQFVAKLHELLMQASIAVVFLHYVRARVCQSSLPFGALLAPMYTSTPSVLWSLDMWSVLTSSSFPIAQKLVFTMVGPCLVVFGALVGPSSAVAMIPRSVNHTLLEQPVPLMVPLHEVFPQTIADAGSIEMKNATVAIGGTFITDYNWPDTSRLLRVSCDTRYTAVATLPSQFGTTVLHHPGMAPGLGVETVLEAPQPMAVARCLHLAPSPEDNGFTKIPTEDSSGVLNGSEPYVPYRLLFEEAAREDQSMIILWNNSDTQTKHSLVALFAAFKGEGTDRRIQLIDTCTVDAFWLPATYTYAYTSGVSAIVTDAVPFATAISPALLDGRLGAQKISLGLKWAESVGETMKKTLNHWEYDGTMESTLAAIVVQRLSVGDFERVIGSYPHQSYGTLRVVYRAFGYGYGSWDTGVIVSLAVLVMYCTLVTGYTIIVVSFGITSTAWDSPAELLALALQSKKPAHLGHTGVGINTMATFREPVQIRVNEGEEVELVFVNDTETRKRKLKKIEPNQAY